MNSDDLIGRLSGETSLGRRIANACALLGGLTTAAVSAMLWATEPGLPPRTKVAFAALIVIGLAWVGYGTWALTRRTPLFALDRVIAAWIGMIAAGVVTVTAVVITTLRHKLAPELLLAVVAIVAVAVVNLVRARRRRAALLRRKRELEA